MDDDRFFWWCWSSVLRRGRGLGAAGAVVGFCSVGGDGGGEDGRCGG